MHRTNTANTAANTANTIEKAATTPAQAKPAQSNANQGGYIGLNERLTTMRSGANHR